MSQDRSNFFELPKQEREELLEQDSNGKKRYLGKDFLPSSKDFLKSIVSDIEKQDTPYVMSIEGGFGTGKTYFVTRLCKYLQDDGTDAVYFNAFEYDDIDPKLAITEEIFKYKRVSWSFKNFKKDWKHCKFWKHKLLKTWYWICDHKFFIFAFFIYSLCQFFFSNGDASNNVLALACLTIIYKYFDSLAVRELKRKEEIKRIKPRIEKLIKNNKKKRLVLIIDELDRCNSKFCLSLLEAVKHFFDINGLFTVLSLNYAHFSENIRKDNNFTDGYFDKFIYRKFNINNDYKKIIYNFFQYNGKNISEDDLKRVHDVFVKNELENNLRQTEKSVRLICKLMEGFENGKYKNFIESKLPNLKEDYDNFKSHFYLSNSSLQWEKDDFFLKKDMTLLTHIACTYDSYLGKIQTVSTQMFWQNWYEENYFSDCALLFRHLKKYKQDADLSCDELKNAYECIFTFCSFDDLSDQLRGLEIPPYLVFRLNLLAYYRAITYSSENSIPLVGVFFSELMPFMKQTIDLHKKLHPNTSDHPMNDIKYQYFQ